MVGLFSGVTVPVGAIGALAPVRAADAGAFERIVTLGDSYSSGSGTHRDAEDYDDHGPRAQSFDSSTRIGSGACHRELDETPGPRLAAELGAVSVFVACAGAVIDEIPTQVDVARIPGDGGGTLVTLTIGGNDVRTERGENWPDALVRCITSSGCHRSDANQIANLDVIQDELTELYTAIGREFPEVVVRALGYPRMMQSDRFCEGVLGISQAEADWIDDQIDDLNARIERATRLARLATGADIRYTSVVGAFDNHGACRFWQRDRYVNDAVLGQTLSRRQDDDGAVVDRWNDSPINVSGSSFHPNAKGYDAYLTALRDSLPGSGVAAP